MSIGRQVFWCDREEVVDVYLARNGQEKEDKDRFWYDTVKHMSFEYVEKVTEHDSMLASGRGVGAGKLGIGE
jgi:hypothetical protein